MFENFVYFREVVKLSTVIEYQLKRTSYSNKLMKEMIRRSDPQVIHMVEFIDNKEIINMIASNLAFFTGKDELWLQCIIKAYENNIEITQSGYHELLLKKFCKYGNLTLVKHFVQSRTYENDECFFFSDEIAKQNPEIIEYLTENGYCIHITDGFTIQSLHQKLNNIFDKQFLF